MIQCSLISPHDYLMTSLYQVFLVQCQSMRRRLKQFCPFPALQRSCLRMSTRRNGPNRFVLSYLLPLSVHAHFNITTRSIIPTVAIINILHIGRVHINANLMYSRTSNLYVKVASDCIWSDPASEVMERSLDETGFGDSPRGGGAVW